MSVIRHVMPVSSIEIEYHSIFLQKISIYLHISEKSITFALANSRWGVWTLQGEGADIFIGVY